MADNTTLNVGTLGNVVRDIDKSGKHTQVVTLDVGGAGAETLLAGTVPVSGTVALSATTQLPASLGSKADADSLAVTQSTEDKAVQTAIAAVAGATSGAAVTTDATGTIQQYLRGIVTKMVAQLPASLGSKAAASALAVTDSTEDIARMGIITETAPASDTASSGLNGRLQRIAQNLTTVNTTLGTKVTSITALETGGVGIIGWLSQIWRDIKGGIVLQAGTNAIGKLAANSGVDIGDVDVATCGAVTPGTLAANLGKAEDAAHASGDVGVMALAVRADTAAPTAANGDYTPVLTDAMGRLWVNVGAGTANLAAAATGGYTPGSFRSAANNNATNVKASAGTLGFLNAINTTATIYYLKLYNKASSPSPASDNALLVGVYPVPANTAGAGIAIPIPPQGLNFSTGISYALVAGLSDTDNTSAATGVCVNYGYA